MSLLEVPIFCFLLLTNYPYTVNIISLTGGEIAQSVEQGTENPRVPGSIPGLATKKLSTAFCSTVFILQIKTIGKRSEKYIKEFKLQVDS